MEKVRGHDQSQLLIVRLLTVGIALVAGIKVLYFLPAIRADAPLAVPLPFTVGLVAEFAIPLVIGIVAFGSGLRLLRRLNGVTAAGHVLAVLLAFGQSPMTDNPVIQPWLLASAGPLMAAVIFLGSTLRSVLGALVGYAILEFPRADNAAAYEYLRATFDIQLVTAAVLGGLVAVTIFYCRRLDDLAFDAAQHGKAAAETRARGEVSVIAAAITHDDILSTLLFGAANNPLFRRAVAGQAQRALTEIEALSADTMAVDSVALTHLWTRVEQMVRENAPDAMVVVPQRSGDSVPAPVADAMLGAVLQALVNSAAHAGAPRLTVRRLVTLKGSHEFLEVRLQDDGVGFDPTQVPASRLGIKASIIGRMRALPGGSAAVDSQRGKGTTVTLSWQASAADLAQATKPSDAQVAEIFTLGLARILSAIFVVGQVLLFAFNVVNGGSLAASIVALLALCVPVVVLASIQFRPGPTGTLAILVGVVAAAAMVFFQNFSPPVMRQDFWFLTGCAFLLMWLLRSRQVAIAWLGMGIIAGMAVTAAISQGVGAAPGLDMVARPIAILLVGTVCSAAVQRLQRQIALVRAERSRSLEREAFIAAAVSQRHVEAVRLRDAAGPLLEILATARDLTAAEATECVALEGSLRDQVLGGRLSRPSIAAAAARARRQGVDVALIDDGNGVDISDAEILRVELWMTDQLEKVSSGRFVGRIPPAGSIDVATIVTTDSRGPVRMGLPREIHRFPWSGRLTSASAS